jgi:hypothetical protein
MVFDEYFEHTKDPKRKLYSLFVYKDIMGPLMIDL